MTRPRVQPVAGLIGRCVLASTLSLAAWTLASGASTSRAQGFQGALHIPLTTSTTTATTSWAVVTMGKNDRQNDLFPQLFVLDTSANTWRLVTPPGIADNGGLFIAPGTGDEVLVGFGASQALSFSPLALSTDGGIHWSPGGLQQALVTVPSAVALGATGTAFALVKSGGQERVLRRGRSLTSWSSELSQKTFATTAPSCVPSAVGVGASNQAVVGSSCDTAGTIGLFEEHGGRWGAIAARPKMTLAAALVQVLAIEHSGTSIAALVALRSRSNTVLVVAYPGVNATWQLSKPLALGKGSTIAATGGGAGRGVFILIRTTHGEFAATNSAPNDGWRRLAALPSSTTSIAIEPSGAVDAFVVRTATLTIWRELPNAGAFQEVQRIVVPIQYGSSA